MSYDINIQKDQEYSDQANIENLKSFISSIPNVIPNGELGFIYGDQKELLMEIDLELMEEDADSVEANGKINFISCHIPYAFWDNDKADKYFVICSTLARHLGWQAIDAQTDQEIHEERNTDKLLRLKSFFKSRLNL